MFAQTPPTILVQPQSYAVVAGSNLTVSVTVTGAPEPGLQWQFNGTNLPGANLATLTLNNMSVAQSGSYDVVVTNSFGSVTSAVARLAAVTINKTWTGGGDGQSWGDANNWNGGTVPAATDSIFIGGSDGTIGVSGSLTVSNLICHQPISFNGPLTVSGAVDVSSNVSFATIITVSGANSIFVGNATTSLTGAVSIFVQQGGLLSLPGLAGYYQGNAISTWQVSGAGSVIDLSGMREIDGPNGPDRYLYIQAIQGGQIRLGSVTAIIATVGGVPGDQRGIEITADGTNSIIDLTSLEQFLNQSPGAECLMKPSNGGRILVPSLSYAVALSLEIGGGATFQLPALTHFDLAISPNCVFSAIGEGSLLDLPALQYIYGPANATLFLYIQATQGGRINLAGVTSIVGSHCCGSIGGKGVDILADGYDSVIDLSGLQLFSDWYDGASYLIQQNGGLILLNSNGVYSINRIQLAPTILNAPQISLTVGSGLTATFSAAVSASPPAYYQWYSNSVPIPGGTNSTLVLNNVQPSWSGSGYSVVVSNAYGSATSPAAILTIPTEPLYTAVSGNGQILVAPSVANYYLGQTFTLTAVPGGYSAFAGWSDANPNNPRTIVINTNNFYTALFTNTVPPVNIAQAGGQLVVFYPNFGTNYRLMTTTNLATGPWVPATNGVPVTAFTFTNTAPAQFFQLQ